VLLLGGALALCALLFDAEPVWVPAIALAALAGGATAWVRLGSRGVRVTRSLAARRVVEEEPLDVRLEVRAGRLPLPAGRLVDPLLPAPQPLPAGRRRAGVRVQVRFGRRGRRRLDPVRVVVADPLGLAVREVVAAGGEDEVLVLPRVEPVGAPRSGDQDERAGTLGRPAAAAEVDLDGLRPLRPGTPASRIYWPAVARGQAELERRLAAEGDSRPLVVLDPRGAAAEEDLDAAVRAAASLAVHLARAGGCSLLVPGERRPVPLGPSLAGWPHLHAKLAVVDGRGRPLLASLTGRRGDVVYVSARVRRDAPRVLQGVAGTKVLVVPGALSGRRAAFAVAGCHGYALGRARAAVEAAA
jgi:uncharacterized protein (DUF58 family)